MARKSYVCRICGGLFERKDVLPPPGASSPPDFGWHCRPCHSTQSVEEVRIVDHIELLPPAQRRKLARIVAWGSRG